MKIPESLYVRLLTTAYMIARRSEKNILSLIKIIMSEQICECLDILKFALPNCPDTSENLS